MHRLRRLGRLRGLLAAGEHFVVRDLAAELGVSTRTLMRDLDLLRDDGLLIETDRGRGGGVRLARRHAAGRVQFTTVEAMSLLVSLAIAERLEASLLDPGLSHARQKIAAAFVRSEQDKIRALRRRVLVGAPASPRVAESYRAEGCGDIGQVRQSFFGQRLLEIVYRGERGETRRRIEPQFIYLTPPAWYFLAWDHLRDGVRAFRFDRIVRARVTDRTFRLRSPVLFHAAAETGAETL